MIHFYIKDLCKAESDAVMETFKRVQSILWCREVWERDLEDLIYYEYGWPLTEEQVNEKVHQQLKRMCLFLYSEGYNYKVNELAELVVTGDGPEWEYYVENIHLFDYTKF